MEWWEIPANEEDAKVLNQHKREALEGLLRESSSPYIQSVEELAKVLGVELDPES